MHKKMAEIFNPFFLVTFQTVFAIALVDGRLSGNPEYLFYVLVPYIIYLMYYVIINRIDNSAAFNIMPSFNRFQEVFCLILILVITLTDIWLVAQIIPFYGGVGGAISKVGSASVVTFLQQDSPEYIRRPVLLNFFLPVAIIPVLLSNLKIKIPVIAGALIASFIFSSLYGARTLFIEPLLICVIIILTRVRISFKSIILSLMGGMTLIVGMAFLQASRSNETGLVKGAEVLSNYYAISLNQGAKIINHDIQRQPMYWTFSPLFNIPIVTSAFGFRTVYEGVFGDLPIQSREDDFNYVKDLGADPNYNTLGIYAYTRLDAGIFGIFILLFIFLVGDYLYRRFSRGNALGYLIFPPLFMLLLDQLRTASLFSARMPYFVMMALIVHILGTLTARVPERSVETKKLHLDDRRV